MQECVQNFNIIEHTFPLAISVFFCAESSITLSICTIWMNFRFQENFFSVSAFKAGNACRVCIQASDLAVNSSTSSSSTPNFLGSTGLWWNWLQVLSLSVTYLWLLYSLQFSPTTHLMQLGSISRGRLTILATVTVVLQTQTSQLTNVLFLLPNFFEVAESYQFMELYARSKRVFAFRFIFN